MVSSLQAGLVDLLQRVLGELDNFLHCLCRRLGTKLGKLVRSIHHLTSRHYTHPSMPDETLTSPSLATSSSSIYCWNIIQLYSVPSLILCFSKPFEFAFSNSSSYHNLPFDKWKIWNQATTAWFWELAGRAWPGDTWPRQYTGTWPTDRKQRHRDAMKNEEIGICRAGQLHCLFTWLMGFVRSLRFNKLRKALENLVWKEKQLHFRAICPICTWLCMLWIIITYY